jgi:uncharacterized MAPEG superfamily protein
MRPTVSATLSPIAAVRYSARMTTPLWCLLGFVAWTLMLLLAVGLSRVAVVLRGEKKANEFPSGVPHGGDAYWRLNRAHMNCVENLPLFASVVLIATIAGVKAPGLDSLARVYLGARVGQSVTHVSSGSVMAVNVRFTFFLIQVGCLIGFLMTIARAG